MTDGNIGQEGNGGSVCGSLNLKYLSVSSDNSTFLGSTPRSASEAFWDCSELLSCERSLNLSDINKLSLNSNTSLLSSTSTLCPSPNNNNLLALLASREASFVSFQVDEGEMPSTSTGIFISWHDTILISNDTFKHHIKKKAPHERERHELNAPCLRLRVKVFFCNWETDTTYLE
jgi:hypothetical protein